MGALPGGKNGVAPEDRLPLRGRDPLARHQGSCDESRGAVSLGFRVDRLFSERFMPCGYLACGSA